MTDNPQSNEDTNSRRKCGEAANVKLSLCSLRRLWGCGGMAARTSIGTSWKWVVSFTSRPALSRIKSHQCPVKKRRGVGTHSLTGHHGNGETSLASVLGLTARGLVTTLTELPRLPHQRKNASTDFTQSLKSAPGMRYKQASDTSCQRNW